MNQDYDSFFRKHQTLLSVLGIIVVAVVVLFGPLITRPFTRQGRNGTPVATASPTVSAQRATRIPPPPTSAPLYPALTAEFEPGACTFGEGDNTVRTYKCEAGEYRMLHKEATTRYAFYKQDFDDAVIQAEGHFESGTGDYEYGIVFRSDLTGMAYYVFTVTNDGRYNVSRYGNDEYTDLIPYTTSSLVRTGTDSNKFKVIMQGDKFDFYLNDQYIGTVTDTIFAKGVTGPFFYNGDENAEVRFTRFTVETFEPN